ncbi:hypothetical protein AVEN_41244-1, partial [Araneus ventricosus]
PFPCTLRLGYSRGWGCGVNDHPGWESPIHVVSYHKAPVLKGLEEKSRLWIKELSHPTGVHHEYVKEKSQDNKRFLAFLMGLVMVRGLTYPSPLKRYVPPSGGDGPGPLGLRPQYLSCCSDRSLDTDDNTNDICEEQGVTVTTTTDSRHLHLSRAEVIPRYNDLLQKVQKVVKLFKRLPTKYDMYLQKYVKEDTGKELSLILDFRTHWNSLLAMIEKFHKLKVCIDKALINIGSDTTFSDLEWFKIKDLIESLQPFMLAVEALCRRD